MITLNTSGLSLLVIALLCAEGNLSSNHFAVRGDRRSFDVDAIVALPAPKAQMARASVAAVSTTKSPDGLFYVTGMIKGVPIRFLVDTGANLVVLTPEDARRIGLAPTQAGAPGDIETAGGPSQIDRVTLDKVSVAGREFGGIDAAVMHNGLKVSLLGQNLLSKLGPITMTGDELTFSPQR
jgi:aspartyl protease family protein